MDRISTEEAIKVLSEGKDTFGTGREDAIKIIKGWGCREVLLDFKSETCVVFINSDNQLANFTLDVTETVH